MNGKNIFTKEKIGAIFKSYINMYIDDIPKTKEELSESLPKLLKQCLYYISFIILGWLFGSKTLIYSSLPMGIALLCSVKKSATFVYMGLLISAVTDKTGMCLPLFLIYTALYLSRILVYRSYGKSGKSFEIFDEGIGFRITEGLFSSLFISFYRVGYFGFLYYDIIGGLFEICFTPCLIALYDFSFNQRYKYKTVQEIGLVSVLCSLILALTNRFVFGFSLSTIALCMITFYISQKAGALRGGIYGIVLGFFSNAVMSPVYALIGLLSGILWRVGTASAIAVSCIGGILCGIYVDGWQNLTAFAPELMLSSIIFAPLVYFNKLPKFNIYIDNMTPENNDEYSLILAQKKQQDTKEKFEALSNAFSELSSVFYMLSDRTRKPRLIDTQEICDSVCDKYCTKCLFKRVCWEKEYSSTSDVFGKIAKELYQRGYVEKGVVDSYLAERCMNIERMLERINEMHASSLESLIKENKTEVFAMDYEAVARLLENAVKSNCDEYEPDIKLLDKLSELNRKMKIHAKSICVFGKRRLNIIADEVDISRLSLSTNEIKNCFENICLQKLTLPEFEIDNEYVTMTLTSARKFDIDFATASSTKKNEQFCGDLICMFENKNDYFYSLISDGMGSGAEAALTSRLCGVFLKKMLLAQNSKPVALEMLNNFIRSKNTECFSTVDLLEIDLLNGNAGFIKSGANASYILRGEKIFRIASNTMPVGITKEINAEEVKFTLEDNDIIVMVSDGVGQSPEDLARIGNMLTFDWNEDLQKNADKILQNAIDDYDMSDDISVGIIRVKEIK